MQKEVTWNMTCLYSTIAALFQLVQNVPYLYYSKIWCHRKCHDSASVKCTMVIPISEVCKAKLLVSLMLEKLKCMGGDGLLWHDVHTEFHGNGLDVDKLLYASQSFGR